MPAQVDGSVAELLITSQQVAHEQASVVEVLWGTAATLPAQVADEHITVVEVLTTAQDAGHDLASVAEVLWLDLTLRVEVEATVVEVLWGTPGTPPAQESGQYASVVEVLTEPPPVGHELASIAEVLVKYDLAVADVQDILGRISIPATFHGGTSLGAISQYRWGWVSVPGGSAWANHSEPCPDGGATTPIDMTDNAVLYHCEETVGAVGTDTSGNGNDATLASITVGVPGLIGSRAWNFTGAASVATLGTPISLATDWTAAFWFYGLAPNTAYRTGLRGQTNHHPLMVNNGTDELGAYETGVGFHPCGFLMPPIEYTGWHHIAVRGISDGLDFFVDGAFVGGVRGFRPSDVDGIFALGNYQGGSQRFAARIDEIAIWTRALSGTEVADLYVLQEGNYTGAGINYTFIPDVDGLYTINLQVVSASTGLLDNDLGVADISLGGVGTILFPLQGDAIRQWAYLQGSILRRRGK